MTPGACDAVVVGAGPAGAAAAFHLARAGLRVTLVDRAAFPRQKVCGGGLTPRAIALLREMGVWEPLASRATRVLGLRTLDLRDGRVHDGALPGRLAGIEFGAVLSRAILDDALREAAVGAGALFVGETDVRGLLRAADGRATGVWGLARGRRFEIGAPVVIAADGVAGAVSGALRPREPVAVEAAMLRQRVRTGPLPARFTVCAPIGEPGDPACGYGWVLPVQAEVANVCVRVAWPRGRRVRARAMLARLLASLRSLDPAFAQARPFGRAERVATPVGFRPEAAGCDGVLLVGDAAAVANPFTGEGIAQALECGRVAAEAVLHEPSGGGATVATYCERLGARFPETTRLEPELAWLVERGGMFAAEFFEVISWRVGLTGGAVREMALEQTQQAASEPAALVAASWTALGERLAPVHPLLAQILAGVRRAAPARLDGTLGRFWSRVSEASPGARQAALAVAQMALALCLVDDTGDTRADAAGKAVGARSTWATNALALGAADVLLAELFALFAELDPRVAAACARAFSAVLRDGAAAAAADRLARPRLGDDLFFRLADQVAVAVTGTDAESAATRRVLA